MVGVGIDTVDVPRFREMMERRPALLEKLFTVAERTYGEKHRDSAPSLAVRFAAKEATMKALGVGLGAFGFHDVEVVSLPSGAPELRLNGRAQELADARGVVSWKISLSHTCTVANAVVIAE